jgi:hypothetical protein
MARALVLRHHLEDHTGLIGDALETRGFEVDLRMMNGDNPSPLLDGYELMVILGSKSAVYDKEVEASWFGRELALIADPKLGGTTYRLKTTRTSRAGPGSNSTLTDAFCPIRPSCGPRRHVRCKHFESGVTWECSSILKSITCSCATGWRAGTTKLANLASTWTP